MSRSSPSPRGCGRWLLLVVLAFWLAVVPWAVVLALSILGGSPPAFLVQLQLLAPREPPLPTWTFGLLATVLTLSLDLLVFVPVFLTTRRSGHQFLHATAELLIAISLFQALNAFSQLPAAAAGSTALGVWFGAGLTGSLLTAVVRLVLGLPFLLLGLAWLEARRQKRSLADAWRTMGLRLWFNPSAMWLALGAAAVIVWPWVLNGSLGSRGTTAGNVVQALPGALGEEVLFRGFAFAWLWRAAAVPIQSFPQPGSGQVRRRGGRFVGAAASLLLFVAAQAGDVLPLGGDVANLTAVWEALPHFVPALLLGLLVTELTVRAGGSVWPAVVVHFLYIWFPQAFADPRSDEEILHWVVRSWMPMAAGGMGLSLWLGRKAAEAIRGRRSSQSSRGGRYASAAFGSVVWLGVVLFYLILGAPGFHPDGFLIFLEEQADLSEGASIADPVERRAWVYDTLVETAERSQAPLRAELDRRGVPYRPHYLINMIEVLDRPGLRRTLAEQPGVDAVLFQPGMRRYPHSFVISNMDPSGPRGVEWNVREVGADRVWELGYTGEGVIVGEADTGVVWDHPALKAAYLGWEAGAASHDYHWYDPWDARTVPWDDNGHGTHTLGTVVGLEDENQIGLAPGSRWIGCRNMRHGLGNPGSYVSCMEFLLAPFPLGGDPFHEGDPARGAHVVNNSWGCPAEEGCQPDTLRIAVDNLRAAGQMMVTSAGNDGPACSTIQNPPALYDAVFSVGAITQGDRAAGFSSRGPVTVDGSGRPKPDLVAPGVEIRSAVPNGYASLPGTSMAGPHVAGAVALLWSVEPSLIGEIDRTEEILLDTAQALTVDAVCAGTASDGGTVCACGDDGPDSVPNQVYGWGQVDVWAAVQRLLNGR